MNTNLSNADASFKGVVAGDEAGRSVAGAGDVDGDGFDDILIGAQGAGAGNTRLGRTYLVLGKTSGWSMDTNLSSVGASFLGEEVNDESGWSVAGAGDVNGDGLDDILIGAQNNNAERGKTYLVFFDDGRPPRIETDSTPHIANTGNWFTFNTTVSDNYAINNVYIEYWFGDSGSHSNLSANESAGNWSSGTWLLTIRIPWNSTDSLHYIIHCRDRAYYVTSSRVKHVPVLDDDLPTVEADATPSNATTGDVFTFSLYAFDNVNLSGTWVEYWYGDEGARTNVSMVHASGGRLWELKITVTPDSLETLHYLFHLVDSSSNTVTTTVRDVDVLDNDLPTLGADRSDDRGTTGDPFTFSMEAWDNLGVEEVRVAYRYGEGPTERVVMDPSGADFWVTTIVINDALDVMHYVIRVTDTSGNYNYTPERVVTILDNDMPEIDARGTAINGTTGDPFTFSIDVRDNVGVEEAWVVHWYGDGHPSNVSLTTRDGSRWEVTVVIEDTVDDMHYVIGVSDTSDNVNATQERTVDVMDDDLPVARAGADMTVAEGTRVVLDGSGSEDNIGVVNWTWTFIVDGEERSYFGASQSHDFLQPGEYRVDLWVRDAGGNTAYDYLVLIVTDETPPLADAGGDVEVDQGTRVTLDGSGSTDNVGIVGWSWRFVYEGAVEESEGRTFQWLFKVPGEYVVTLTVRDTAGHQASDDVGVVVRDIISPVAASLLNMKVDQGTEVTLDGSGSTDNVGVVRWTWTFAYGDGEVTLDGITTSFIFAIPGEYRVNLTVEDGAGNKDATTFLIFVKDTVAPSIPKMRDIRVGPGEAVTMDASEVTDNVGVVRFSWTFEEGGKKVALDGSHVEHTFEKTGKYEVTLTAWDEEGNQAVETFEVNVISYFWLVATILLVAAALMAGGFLYLRKRRSE